VQALNVVRIESGVPDYGVDMDESNLAQETGLEAEAISYDKGCYLGQEVVARVHFRGHVNRHLRSLSFPDTLPERGVALLDQDKEVGVVTSAVMSPDYGAIGLGYVRREIAPSHGLSWSGPAGRGEAVVLESPFRSPTV
jgi:folate-binding protein YgfZ